MGKKGKVLVTGGCGYIGSHTLVELIQSGYEVICLDSNIRSDESLLEGVEKITGIKVKNNKIDLTDYNALKEFFESNKSIEGVIHFAALKLVGESVEKPFLYFQNNTNSLNNLLELCRIYKVKHFIFSSSCTVYGRNSNPPVNEDTPFGKAESPYGRTKQIGEYILEDFHKMCDMNIIPLRYFNPVGAHESNEIGEIPYGKPNNLIPYITQTAIGKLPVLTVFGSDYNTHDGTAIRDYIHVSDIASAHVLALDYLIHNKLQGYYDCFNLGTGEGSSVLEVINAFEKVNEIMLNYQIGDRRPGDLEATYADNKKARELLGWGIRYSLEDMMRTAWEWEKRLAE